MSKRIIYGVAGTTGLSLVAWRTLFPWIGEDMKTVKAVLPVAKEFKDILETGKSFIEHFEEHVMKEYAKRPMIIFEDQIFTYEFVNEQANRVANLVRSWSNVHFGDTVAILIYNEPAFVWTVLGLQKIGVVASFINHNLRLQQLSHCLKVCEAKALIVGTGKELLQAVEDIRSDLNGMPVYVQGASQTELPAPYLSFDDLMIRSLPVQVDKSVRSQVETMSPVCYIYTSGTTGLPKPAIITQFKFTGLSLFIKLVNVNSSDTVYVNLPLYHTSAALGMFGTIWSGGTVLLRRKFSASRFWDDCRKYRITVIQYIGELCRYLLIQPKSKLDGVHCVRAAIGNGLRKDIWLEFQHRFKIPHICEFYSATESTGLLINACNVPGAIGRLSPFLGLFRPRDLHTTLVKFDYNTTEPLRNKNGHCIEIRPGETGLFISSVPDLFREKFRCYKASDEANRKKLIADVFKEGDLYFNSGDLLYLDKNYFVYFVDRTGDTFRWKGENVSTTEVANILTKADFIEDANVYGVTVPGHDGQAGMAAITLQNNKPLTAENLASLVKICEENLPSYARPIFLRVQREATLTATFKQKKFQLVKEGFDPNKVKDPLYYYNQQLRQFVPITREFYPKLLTRSKL